MSEYDNDATYKDSADSRVRTARDYLTIRVLAFDIRNAGACVS